LQNETNQTVFDKEDLAEYQPKTSVKAQILVADLAPA
jgi:hypothetical protein